MKKELEKQELPQEESPKIEKSKGDGIEVGEPMDLRPKNLPLVVKLPSSASSAQVEYAKILNGYAYQNPEKWAKKKDLMLARLRSLAGKEVVTGDKKLSINKSTVSFAFIRDNKGNEFWGGDAPTGRE